MCSVSEVKAVSFFFQAVSDSESRGMACRSSYGAAIARHCGGARSFLVVTFFASVLAERSPRLRLPIFQSVPLGLFGVAFSLAAFPMLSGFAAKDERRRFADMLPRHQEMFCSS